MTRKLTASIFCLSLLPVVLIASQNAVAVMTGQPIKVTGTQQEETAFERIFWNKIPVSVTLKTGSERLIHFPDMIKVQPPEGVTGEELKMSIVNNVVYLKALKDFPVGRMNVQAFNHQLGSFKGGKFYFIDLSAKARGGTEQIKIIDKDYKAQASHAVSENMPNSSAQVTPAASLPKIEMVDLTRYVSQQLYSPQRLTQSHPAIFRTPLRIKTLNSLYRGGELKSTPLASWKGGGLYITAVKLQNQTNQSLTLDPRLFRGQWRSRTLQHTGLSRLHTESDTTTVYLISDRPFQESLWF